ncbi:late promoter transcriptional regulator [Serratia phage 92A1]|nr:late promoter transcriptional regulator [Serratia phage 92A1]
MTACSHQNKIVGTVPNTAESGLLDKTHAGLAIEQMLVNDSSLGYLEATVQWMEENSIEPSQFKRYIPQAIIDKIEHEAKSNQMLRPSVIKSLGTTTLDFLL